MTDPIALFLPVFAPTDIAEIDAPTAPAMTMPEPGFLDDDLVSLGDDEGARIAQARDEALAEAAIATEAALAAQAADLESRHAEAMAEERRRWIERESTVLAEQLRAGLAALERGLAEGVVEILQPFLGRAVRAKAAEELREAVTQLLANGDTAAIRIAGPADLVEPLRLAFADEAAIDIAASEAPEVTVEAGDTTMRTQLQAWAAALDGHMAEVG